MQHLQQCTHCAPQIHLLLFSSESSTLRTLWASFPVGNHCEPGTVLVPAGVSFFFHQNFHTLHFPGSIEVGPRGDRTAAQLLGVVAAPPGGQPEGRCPRSPPRLRSPFCAQCASCSLLEGSRQLGVGPTPASAPGGPAERPAFPGP